MTDLNVSGKASRVAVAGLVALLLAVVAALAGGPGKTVAATGDTVHIRGVAYAFFGIDDHAPGAVIRVDEFPELSAPVALDGSYEIQVPDDENVTLYIDPPATYVRTYLQTFHTCCKFRRMQVGAKE